MATLKDVAEAVGVSVTAASLVLNKTEETKEIGKDTAERIRAKARELGYRPNAAAQSLARGRTMYVGVVAPRFGDFMGLRRLEETVKAVVARGYHPILSCPEWSSGGWEYTLDTLISNNVSGVILEGFEISSNAEIVEQLRGTQIPTVSLDAGDVPPGAGIDRSGAFYELTRVAIETGHRQIGYLDSGRDYATFQPRLEGIEKAIDEIHNVTLSTYYPFKNGSPRKKIPVTERAFRVGYVGGELFLKSDDRPSAMIYNSDNAAITFMNAVQSKGVKIPEDVAVFGFDGVPEGRYSRPPLTTVAQPLEQMSEEAVSRLLRLIDEPDSDIDEYKHISSPLIVRESSGPLADDDRADSTEQAEV